MISHDLPIMSFAILTNNLINTSKFERWKFITQTYSTTYTYNMKHHCPFCNLRCKSLAGLTRHTREKHNLLTRQAFYRKAYEHSAKNIFTDFPVRQDFEDFTMVPHNAKRARTSAFVASTSPEPPFITTSRNREEVFGPMYSNPKNIPMVQDDLEVPPILQDDHKGRTRDKTSKLPRSRNSQLYSINMVPPEVGTLSCSSNAKTHSPFTSDNQLTFGTGT